MCRWPASRADLATWQDQLRSRYAPATIARMVGVVRRWYRWLHRNGHLPQDLADHLTPPRADPTATSAVALTGEQLDTLLRVADTWRGPAALRIAAELRLMALCGLRVGEVCRLRVEHLVAGPAGLLIRFLGKGRVERRVHLDDQETVVAIARDLAARHGPGWHTVAGPLLTTRDGGPLRPQVVQDDLRRVAAAARLGSARHPLRVHPHMLRATFATLALDAGCDLAAVQDALGHASPETTRRFYDARRHRSRSAVVVVSEARALRLAAARARDANRASPHERRHRAWGVA